MPVFTRMQCMAASEATAWSCWSSFSRLSMMCSCALLLVQTVSEPRRLLLILHGLVSVEDPGSVANRLRRLDDLGNSPTLPCVALRLQKGHRAGSAVAGAVGALPRNLDIEGLPSFFEALRPNSARRGRCLPCRERRARNCSSAIPKETPYSSRFFASLLIDAHPCSDRRGDVPLKPVDFLSCCCVTRSATSRTSLAASRSSSVNTT